MFPSFVLSALQHHYKHIQERCRPEGFEVRTDTDFNGCQKTGKSTSGGIVRHASHIMKSWSTNQAVVALSSGEVEYYGMEKGARGGMGVTKLCRDLGVEMVGSFKVKNRC